MARRGARRTTNAEPPSAAFAARGFIVSRPMGQRSRGSLRQGHLCPEKLKVSSQTQQFRLHGPAVEYRFLIRVVASDGFVGIQIFFWF